MAAGQNVLACHFPADTSAGVGGGEAEFDLLMVALSSGARPALQRSVRRLKLRWAMLATNQ